MRKYTTVEVARFVVTVNKALEVRIVPKVLLTMQLKRLPESLGCTLLMEYGGVVAPVRKAPFRRHE